MSRKGNSSERVVRTPLGTSTNVVFTIIIIAIVGASIIGYVVFENNSERDVRFSVFEQYKERQVIYANAIVQNMQSDLNLLMGKLETVALSKQVQDRDFAGPEITALLNQIYDDANVISEVDGVYIIDKDDVVLNYFNPSVESSVVVGIDASDLEPVVEYWGNLPNPTFTTAYKPLGNATLRIALLHPIYNSETGEHMGAAGMVLVLDSFFSHYGNIQDLNSQYFAALDSKGTILVSAAKDIVGRNVFSDYVYAKHPDKSAYDHYRKVMNGSSSVAAFGLGTFGERINVGEPIILNEKAAYSLFVVTPTAAIYAEIDRVLGSHRAETFLFLAIISAAISLSIFFLVRWNTSLRKSVLSRTQELEDANTALQEHDKLQREFINIAAHELRTPIQPLLGVTELIEKSMDGKDKSEITKEDVQMLTRNAKRLERLSSEILEVSRIESQSLKLNKELLNLNEKIGDVIKDLRSFIPRDHKIEIIFNSDSETTENPIFVEGDSARIFQVLSNIIRNAIKFTENGAIQITLRKDEKAGRAVVKVTDTGKGIDPEIFPRLFTKFATRSEQGTGLGLYISKAIVESHGGEIWAENNGDDRGATFIFTLPLGISGK